MTTLRRTEPTTATAAVALTVGVSAVSRLVGAPVVPLSVFQPLGPVAGTVGRVALDNATRVGWVMLLVAAPMWGGFHGMTLDHFDDGGLLYEAPVTGLVVMMLAGFALLQVRDAGVLSARLERAAERPRHRDPAARWIILTRGIFKRRRSSRIAGSQTVAAARLRRGLSFSLAKSRAPRAPFDLNTALRLNGPGFGMAALEDLRREPLKESEIKLAVEAVLFSSSRALAVREIATATGAEPRKVKRALTGLKREYSKRQTSIELAKIGTKWTLQLKNRFVPVAAGYASTKIPKNLLKTIALIAYHQPIKQSELLNMVGQRVYDHVHALEDMKVVRHIPWGNSKILFTTHRFSEIFGIEGNSRDDIKRWMAKQIGIPAEQVDRDIKKSHDKEKQMGPAVAENEAADAAAKAEVAAAAAAGDPAGADAAAGEE